MKAQWVFGVVIAVLGLGGCARKHLTPTHSASNRAAYSRQVAAPKQEPRPARAGLDSEEAAIIADSYRASLAPKSQRTSEEPSVLILPDPSRQMRSAPLAPSVPPASR